jgi:membrane protease YdiL (CAAX protease family)
MNDSTKSEGINRNKEYALVAAFLLLAAYTAAIKLIPSLICPPESAWRILVSSAVRLSFALALSALWQRRLYLLCAEGEDRRLFTSSGGADIALGALGGALLQIAASSAVALARDAETLGERADLSDFSSWVLILTAVAVAPVCEELVFRGAAFRLMRSAVPTLPSALICAVFFSLLHSDAISAAVAFYVGFLLALVVRRRASLAVAVAFHASFNLTSFFVGYLPQIPALWLALCASAALFCIIALLKGKKK